MKTTFYTCDKCGKDLDSSLFKATFELYLVNRSGLQTIWRKGRSIEPITQHYCRNCIDKLLFIDKQ